MRPQFGPDRPSDTYPLTDAAEVREARRVFWRSVGARIAFGSVPNWLSEVEAFDSAAELGAARDLELWGCNPFEED